MFQHKKKNPIFQKISTMGFGCEEITRSNHSIIDEVINHGINIFDTADCYGNGESEIALGEIIKKYNREDIFICTKVGVKLLNNDVLLCADEEYIKQACEESLRRLGLEYIDLYYLHRIDPETPLEESILALSHLVKMGKVKLIGLSEVNANQIRRAHALHPISFVQIEYSPWSRQDEENEVIETCRDLNIKIVSCSPLGRGFFTHLDETHFSSLAENDQRRFLPRYNDINLVHNLAVREKLQAFAQQKHCTLAQLVIAWEIAQGVIPIPATTKNKHFLENVAALQIQLSADELNNLNSLIRNSNYVGLRYPNEKISAIYPEKVTSKQFGPTP